MARLRFRIEGGKPGMASQSLWVFIWGSKSEDLRRLVINASFLAFEHVSRMNMAIFRRISDVLDFDYYSKEESGIFR